VIRRECERAGWNAGTADGEQFTRELRAIAALIGEHRAEFDGYLSGLGDTIDLRARRLSRKAR
jgi:hypothetical protein